MNEGTMRSALGELVGTFILVTLAAGTVVAASASRGQVALLGIAFAYGVAYLIGISIFYRVSGGHLNPAVTIGLWVGRAIDAATAISYIVAQLIGAVIGALVLRVVFSRTEWEPVQLGTPTIAAGLSPGKAILVEAVITFIVMLAFLGAGSDRFGMGTRRAYAAGLALLAGVLFAGTRSGGAANPARWFGPALVGAHWKNAWVFIVGPIIGAVLAAILYQTVFSDEMLVAPDHAGSLTDE